MALRLYRANRVERLLQMLLDVLRQTHGDPLRPETLMVQNPGMATWISRNMADRYGICAGIDFLFPRKVIQQAFAAVLGEDAYQVHAYDPARLIWTVLTQLPNLIDRPEFKPLKRYLRQDPGDRKRVQLVGRIADVFDQYALYRPEMVTAWENGRENDWQPQLWRAITKELGYGHIASLTRRFTQAMTSLKSAANLPRRLCCFGISTLPPLYVHVLQLISQHIDVFFFLLQPTSEFFADIRSRREIDRVMAYYENQDEAGLALTEGHPLLASMGRMAREFQQVLVEFTHHQDEVYFQAPDPDTMLAVLQHDMMHLIRRDSKTGNEPPFILDQADQSILIHACHGPMREVEVLRDHLLELFSADASLSPSDVVVMMPDVEIYSPLIEAAFSTGGPKHLPYSIADRSFRGASPVIDAFFRSLDLIHGRASASEVLDLLSMTVVAQRYKIAPEELETISDWITSAGIRWGIDATHRAHFGQPGVPQNSWLFGLQRLLLGYALPTEDALFETVLPRDQVEGNEARILGRFVHFSETLFALLAQLKGKRTMDSWQKLLLRLLEAIVVADGENEWQHQQVRAGLDSLVKESSEGGFTEKLGLVAVRAILEQRIEYDNESWNFLAEGITFCAMVPMRSIPFRVVAMMGLNDGAFPRSRRPVNFDKIAQKPRPGDRSKRNEERYLFLEALLAARDRVIITYVGQDIKDNAPLPPSVVVSELIDTLAQSFYQRQKKPGDREAIEARIVLRHPMQGFNPHYFNPSQRPELFSYSDSHFKGAQGFVAPPTKATALFSEPFPQAESADKLNLEELVHFYKKPIPYLMRNRLGFTFDEQEKYLSDREPMNLIGLEKYQAGTELLERRLKGLDEEESRILARAEGSLPLGTPGEVCFNELSQEISPLFKTIQQWDHQPLPPLDVDIDLDGIKVIGRLRDLYDQGMFWYQFKRLNGKHLIAAWLRHLALCTAKPENQHTSIWVGRGKGGSITKAQLGVVTHPKPILQDLVDLYRIGLNEPLLFFPETSWSFAKQKKDSKAHEAARRTWRTGGFAESKNLHHVRAFGESEVTKAGYSLFDQPMAGGDFPSLARRVFGPLLAHFKEQEIGMPD